MSNTTKIYKEHYSSPKKAKEAAANLRKGGIKAKVSKTPRKN
jgi:hypothetical protein